MLQYLYQPVCNHKKITKRKQNQKQNKQKSDKKTKKNPPDNILILIYINLWFKFRCGMKTHKR